MALPPLTEALQPLLESLDEALHQRERERRPGLPAAGRSRCSTAERTSSSRAPRRGWATLARAALDAYAPDGPTFAHALGCR
jgi:hypothetical protein